MQEEVHKEMMSEGVAKKPNKQWYTKEWIVVDNEQEGIGLEIEYEIIRIHRLMFVNEVGSNTSQAKDGNVGGEKFLSISGGRPQICASTKDDHFTVLARRHCSQWKIQFSVQSSSPQKPWRKNGFLVWIHLRHGEKKRNT